VVVRPALALVLALALAGCQARRPAGTQPAPSERLHVLLINGGGNASQNYQSHLLHVRQLLELLGRAGVPPQRISVLSGDGADPAPDLAVRELETDPDFWLLHGTPVAGKLKEPIVYEDSRIPGWELEHASERRVEGWFEEARRALHPGDTLLLYVTDHGTKDDKAPREGNAITLWMGDALTVTELRRLTGRLRPGVRVVMVMSQCFSGGFAHLPLGDGPPSGNVCGYFSSTWDRMAYGCYPENRGRDNVGHSFALFEALASTPDLASAHRETLVTDGTPDVPLRTSDVYLAELLDAAAQKAERERSAFVDELLREAWREKARWEPEIRLLDRIGHAYGLFSPRSLAELEEQARALPATNDTLQTYADAWRATLGDLTRVNFERFLTARPAWKERLEPAELEHLGEDRAGELRGELLADLAPFTRRQPRTGERLALLRGKAETAAAARYRMEVRLAVVLRLRTLLTTIAGRQYLETRGTREERRAYGALATCEDLRLASEPLVPGTPVREAEPFPRYADELRLVENVLPAWMGIRYRPSPERRRAEAGLRAGAATVVTVYPDSPAAAAGLDVGDVVLGPPGGHFSEPGQIREWTMTSRIGQPTTLDVLRRSERRRVTLVPAPLPVKWPELPGPPKVGSVAPAVELARYRGDVPARLAGGPYLLFFWATWCLPCKAALPELLAYEAASDTPVIAVTDEPAEHLDGFFARFAKPFPEGVAVDDLRRSFMAYGVSGTPTFVLVDRDGKVASYHTGYERGRGIGIEGWSWTPPAGATAGGAAAP
jgi:thiol-disulfide isomerase/thioredoxin